MKKYKEYLYFKLKDNLNLNKPDFTRPSKSYYKKRKSDLLKAKKIELDLKNKGITPYTSKHTVFDSDIGEYIH